jgi:DNA-binding NarL/FixJ family response regulator
MNKIRIAYIEDEPYTREGTLLLLKPFSDIEIVSSYSSPDEFIRDRKNHNKIEILLLDIKIGDSNLGLNALKFIRDSNLKIKVIGFTSIIHDNRELLQEIMQLGARGCLDKGIEPQALFDKIRCVHEGDDYVFSQKVLNLVARGYKVVLDYDQLTKTEIEVFKLVAMGKDKHKIAEICNVDVRTIEKHKSNINHKFYLTRDIEYLLKAIELRDEEVLNALRINPL